MYRKEQNKRGRVQGTQAQIQKRSMLQKIVSPVTKQNTPGRRHNPNVLFDYNLYRTILSYALDAKCSFQV